MQKDALGDLTSNHGKLSHTFESPNEWIQYDMIDKQIQLTHYTIKNVSKYCHLEQWEILGSNNGENFTIIDKKNIKEPNGSIVFKTYEIQNPPQQFYRYIRIKQTGLSTNGKYTFPYNCFEFFGKMKPI